MPRGSLASVIDMPAYSVEGLNNRDLFLEGQNAVLIYCEDEGFEEFYGRLLRRLVPDVMYEDILCLGGKTEVLKKASEGPVAGKKRVFLLDKDFDDITGVIKSSAGIVYLGRYSIENYLLDDELLADFVIDNKRRFRRVEYDAALSVSEKLAHMFCWYEDLCRKFVLTQGTG